MAKMVLSLQGCRQQCLVHLPGYKCYRLREADVTPLRRHMQRSLPGRMAGRSAQLMLSAARLAALPLFVPQGALHPALRQPLQALCAFCARD